MINYWIVVVTSTINCDLYPMNLINDTHFSQKRQQQN